MYLWIPSPLLSGAVQVSAMLLRSLVDKTWELWADTTPARSSIGSGGDASTFEITDGRTSNKPARIIPKNTGKLFLNVTFYLIIQ